jgi:hypothetical protein
MPLTLPISTTTSWRMPPMIRRAMHFQAHLTRFQTHSSTKRTTAGSVASTAFSESTKLKIDRLYGRGCWHCPATIQHTAHAFARADMELDDCRRLGLVNLESHRHVANAVHLCATCHHAFDALSPKLLIVPYDLDPFFEAERRWQASYPHLRCARPPVTAERYAEDCESRQRSIYHDGGLDPRGKQPMSRGLYRCYMVENYFGWPGIPNTCIRVWHGDPGAMLRHTRTISRIARVPAHLREVKQKLRDLEDLYDRGNQLLDAADAGPSQQVPFPSPGSTNTHKLPPTSSSSYAPHQPSTMPAAMMPNDTSSTTQFQGPGGHHLLAQSIPHSPHRADNSFSHGCHAPHTPEAPSLAPGRTHDTKRKRIQTPSEPDTLFPSPVQGTTHKQEVPVTTAPRKSRRVQLKPNDTPRCLSSDQDSLPLENVAHVPQKTKQPMYRWGGPHASTKETVEYYKSIFLCGRE